MGCVEICKKICQLRINVICYLILDFTVLERIFLEGEYVKQILMI